MVQCVERGGDNALASVHNAAAETHENASLLSICPEDVIVQQMSYYILHTATAEAFCEQSSDCNGMRVKEDTPQKNAVSTHPGVIDHRYIFPC